jgi:hypothetical protein
MSFRQLYGATPRNVLLLGAFCAAAFAQGAGSESAQAKEEATPKATTPAPCTTLDCLNDAVQQATMANLTNPVGDSVVNIFNAGANGGSDATGTIVAQVYVFDAVDEQLIACCSCPLTPDQNATISGKNALISNPLTPHIPSSITVKLVGTKGGSAATDQRKSGAPGFSAGMRATRTTLHVVAGVGNVITELPFFNVKIADSEYNKLVTTCNFIQLDGSRFGICGGCSAGALAPVH